MTILIVVGFAAIAASLAFALYFMLRNRADGKSSDMATALSFRIGISVVLFCCVLAAWALGWIQPSGLLRLN